MFPTLYAEALVTKSLRREEVYVEHVLKGIFIEGHQESVRHCMQSYLSTNAESTLYDLDRHETSISTLQKETDVRFDKGSYHRRKKHHR